MVKKITNFIVWFTSGGLLLGSLAFVAVATPLVGNRALIVRSGSMEPAISAGDVVVVRPADGDYKAGHIIAYELPGQDGVMVTHRIVDVQGGTPHVLYRTKGDANDAPDEYMVSASDILGREIFTIPVIGKLLALAKTKLGFVIFVVIPALAVIAGEVWVIIQEVRSGMASRSPSIVPLPAVDSIEAKPREVFVRSRFMVDSISRRLIIFIAALVLLLKPSWALLTDSGTSSSNSFTAAETFGLPSPSPTPEETPEGIADHVVISEVQLREPGTGNADKDFVELYNPTAGPIDISGWRIRNKTSSGVDDNDLIQMPEETIIASHGFLLWANSLNGYAVSLNAEVNSAETIADNNSIALTLADGTTIVDGIGWGSLSGTQYTEGTVPPNLATSKSYERKALSTSTESSMESSGADEFKGNGFDSEDNSNDFIIRDNPEPQNSASITEAP